MPHIILASVFCLGFALAVVLFSKYPDVEPFRPRTTRPPKTGPAPNTIVVQDRKADQGHDYYLAVIRSLRREVSGLRAEISQSEGVAENAAAAIAANKILEEEVRCLRATVKQESLDAAAAKAALREENRKLASSRQADNSHADWCIQTWRDSDKALKEQLKDGRDQIKSLTDLLSKNREVASNHFFTMLQWRQEAIECQAQAAEATEQVRAAVGTDAMFKEACEKRDLLRNEVLALKLSQNGVREQNENLTTENARLIAELAEKKAGVQGAKDQIQRFEEAGKASEEMRERDLAELQAAESSAEKESKLRAKAERAVTSLRERVKDLAAKSACKDKELATANSKLSQLEDDLQKAKEALADAQEF
jgi:chromosome segregation ATPase